MCRWVSRSCLPNLTFGTYSKRHLSSSSSSRHLPLISIPPNTSIYSLGSSFIPTTPPLLQFDEKGFNVPSTDNFGLAVVGDGDGRRRLVECLLSRHRFHPLIPTPGPFPSQSLPRRSIEIPQAMTSIISLPDDPLQAPPPPTFSAPPFIRHLTFSRPSATGEFTDYTARYGSLQESDRVTLTSYFLSSLYPPPSPEAIAKVAEQLRIQHLLDLPVVALSSGQTRRARIGAGLLTRPRVLLLEDPFAGLDPSSRAEIGDLLGQVNNSSEKQSTGAEEMEEAMRLILILRGNGSSGLPGWITHVTEVAAGKVFTYEKEEYLERLNKIENKIHTTGHTPTSSVKTPSTSKSATAKSPLVVMSDINVSYGSKKVLSDVSWTIRPGNRWHLQGTNGSGKTTLISILLGHHPRSFSLPAKSLTLFGKPRREMVTGRLKQLMGHASPEIFAAFPRSMGLSAGEAVGSGFEGVFARRRLDPKQKERVMNLIKPFKDLLNGRSTATQSTESIFEQDFSSFPPNQQALLMFLRAIVARPPLLVLDEASQAMDEATWDRCRSFLEREWLELKNGGVDQAVICVSHYEEEVPWPKGEGEVLRLQDGLIVPV